MVVLGGVFFALRGKISENLHTKNELFPKKRVD